MIRADVRAGEIQPDDHLVEEDLVRRYGASRAAVREALQWLVDDGIVSRRPRHGTNVLTGTGNVKLQEMFPLAAGQRTHEVTVVPLVQQVISAPPAVADRLETTDTRLLYYEQLVTFGGTPSTLRASYIPLEHLPDHLPGRAIGSRTTVDGWEQDFEELFGLPLAEITSTVEATTADATTASPLGIATGSAVLVWEALLRAVDRRPRVMSFTYYRAGLMTLTMRERKLPWSDEFPAGTG
jgi:GntR family transcriptional regulator